LRFLVIFFVIVAAFFAVCMLVPAPNYALLPLTVATPELAQWVLVFDVAALVMAIASCRSCVPVFAIAGCISLWPVMASHLSVTEMYRIVRTPETVAERLPLNILLYRAAGAGLHPVLVEIYGGAWQRGTPARDREFNRYMAARGYAVFAIEYRHAPQYVYPAQIVDVRAAISFIHANAARYGADGSRIALLGKSAGGQLALLAAYERAGNVPIRAVVALYPPSDLARGYHELPKPDPIGVGAALRDYLGGTPEEAPDNYREASPITYAAAAALPATLLVQGQRDHVVEPKFTAALRDKLRGAGNRVTLVEIPWAEHSFDDVFQGLGNRIALAAIEEFLDAEMKRGARQAAR
jgi:acetyl esterase/lipase